ncbi:TetR/AcrR family transcriptional regulator [Mycolicibacterium vinylchloridicum]|uniref:TetR/AcrR family transcriptional regulator n=1 Tax=Mycolicibacterium vinylchloridicum TaxID=2736928 RepID=UPI0015CE7F85|nr:TetR/AcrR family transcriptional regulator [Mycolicibacterium vinylchloridicum]
MASRSGVRKSAKLHSILIATSQLMLEHGYAAVTFRGVATRAAVAPGLVQYYFSSIDELFAAVLRDATDRIIAELEQAARSEQPLRAAWTYANDAAGNALLMEFMALANHREALRSVIGEGGERVRTALLESIAPRWASYGLDEQELPPAAALFLMSCIPRMIHLEAGLGTRTGHSETTALVQRFLDRVEPLPRSEAHD